MAEVEVLRCVLCGCAFLPGEAAYTCPECGEVGTLDVLYDYAALAAHIDRGALAVSRDASAWRYRALLPLPESSPLPNLALGWTPLYDAPRVAEALGVRQAWLKDDGRNPTGSLKDRASSVVVARAMADRVPVIATASTGNAAAALAGFCAATPDVRAVIFVPASAPEAKIAQLLVYGATVLLIEGSYDQAFDLCTQTCLERGWVSRNTGVNPYTTEGKKSVALEIAEQLGWQVPDVVVVSVGDGSIISGTHKGFVDLKRLGWIARVPRLIGVQAEGSSPLARAWQDGLAAEAMQPVAVTTIADSISAGLPRDRAKALRAVRETGGAFVTVSDQAILQGIPELAQRSGVFAEPAAVAAFVGARRAVQSGVVHPEESVAIIITGNGLKDVLRARQAVGSARLVAPDAGTIRRVVDETGLNA
jgi:threonine synthase